MRFGKPLSAQAQQRVAIPFAICTFVWGSTWFVIASQLQFHVPAIWSISWRFALATIGMFAVAIAMRAPLRLPRGAIPLVWVIGLTQFTLNYVLVYAAEAQIASGLVAIVSALLIVPNAVMGQVFLGQRLSRRFLIGAGIAIAGLALLFAHELGQSGGADRHRLILGIVLSLAALLSASVANVLQGTTQARALPNSTLIAWSMLCGTAINLTIASTSDWPPRLPLAPLYLAGLAYLALMGSVVTFSLYSTLIRSIGPARVGYVSVLTPIMAMALSTLFEGYRWTPTAAAGAALALAGLVVAMRARSPAR